MPSNAAVSSLQSQPSSVPEAFDDARLDADAWLEKADEIARYLAETAVERDQTGGHAAEQKERIRQSGLLSLSIPKAQGGAGQSWSLIYQVIRKLASADSALAHIFAFHHLQVSSVLLYGSQDQVDSLLGQTAANRLFWGNTLNPLDKRTLATEYPGGGFVFDGVKGFCSGARGSDYLTASAWHEPTQSLVVAAIPTIRDGITVHGDWDAIGQRQTDSGTVTFNQVIVAPSEVLLQPGIPWTPAAHYRSCLAQLVLVNLYAGIAEGAFREARTYTLEQANPWFTSGAPSSGEDPFIQHHYGELRVKLRSAQVLADVAGDLVDRYFPKGPAITARDRGETAIAIADAKVAAHHAALDISSRLFDIAGARATSRRFGYDRFWRNARTHTLHDPIDYKLRDLGRWELFGDYPTPTSYS
jgi:alkylation response protein AidB-like acyl-CoA dehydrogenase